MFCFKLVRSSFSLFNHVEPQKKRKGLRLIDVSYGIGEGGDPKHAAKMFQMLCKISSLAPIVFHLVISSKAVFVAATERVLASG
jgi:hypothetical protein